tara:strand:+ start:8527 stop:8874 length:348 start_codon:yes stop_codon:yes gene_type:complete
MKTQEDKKTFLKILKGNGGNINDACNVTNIARRTIYVWIEKEKWFKESIEDIRETSIDNVESALYKNAIEGNTSAQIFYLKCKGKKRGYVERSELDLTSGDEPIKINVNIKGVEY